MARRTPQEKKALSYARDRRNDYGESTTAARKAIPLRKRLVNRANRHRAQQDLVAATGRPDSELADAAEQRLGGRRPKIWRKWRDAPLGEIVDWQLRRRAAKQAGDDSHIPRY